MSDATQSDHGLFRSGSKDPSPGPALVIVWSASEPMRVGEILRPSRSQATVLGRGEPTLAGGEERGVFHRERPGVTEARPALAGASLSRRQAVLRVTGEALDVTNQGRGGMRINGKSVDAGRLGVGDTLALADQLVLLACERAPAPFPGHVAPPSFAFGEPDAHGFVGESTAAWTLRAELTTYAKLPGHVLVLGPTGAGKELCARALHTLSDRAGRPFVSRNAATIPEGIVDAELFGNVKGYPNPGMPDRAGLFGEAHGGTLFLDELGELSHGVSAHLLRVLDRGELQRLGDAAVRTVDVRVVAATNRSRDELKFDVAQRFVHEIRVPDLVARREDVPLLVRHVFRAGLEKQPALARFADAAGHVRTSPRFVEALVRQPFPGNARELMSLVWKSVATSGEGYLDLTSAVRDALAEVTDGGTEPSAEAVRDALAKNAGNVTRAAAALGLRNRNVLYRLMDRFGVKATK